ncbi:MAG: ABC transporter permease [Planctomycetota bacterium]
MTKSFRLDGVNKERFLDFWDLEIPEDALAKFRETRNGMIVGRRVWEAYKDRWSIGSTVSLGVLNDTAAVLCGVFDGGGTAMDSRGILDRRFMQEAKDKQGICNNIVVKVDRVENVESVIEAIDEKMTFTKKTESQSESTLFADLVKELSDMRTAAGMIASVALLAVFFGIWNAISMTVRDRTQEFGVLRTLGFNRPKIAGLVLMEGAAIALIGGALAIPLIAGGVELFKAIYGDITFMGINVGVTVEPVLLALSVPTAVVAGVLSSIVPAMFASSKSIVDALRSVD